MHISVAKGYDKLVMFVNVNNSCFVLLPLEFNSNMGLECTFAL